MESRVRRALTATLLAGLGLAGTFARAEPPGPLLAVDPLPAGAELESHTAALSRWLARGSTGAALLLVDASGRASPLGAGQAAALADLRSRRGASPADAPDALGKRPPLEAGFVRAAIALGIAREAYWIAPFSGFRGPEAAEFLRAELSLAGFAEEEIRAFELRDGCFRGALAGAPFAVCGPEALPVIAAPVLLAFNTDYVMAAAAGGTNPLGEARALLLALAAGRYAVLDAVVITSVEPESTRYLSPDLRWIGGVIAESLREPAILSRPEPPKRWMLLQTLALLESAGDYQEMLHQALPYLTIHEDDPALHLYAAIAHVGRGRPKDAFGHGLQACRLHQGYCFGLPWLGQRLFEAGEFADGERFFAAGERLRPGMLYGQLLRGMALQQAGRGDEALRAFLALSDAGDVLPAAILAGALHLRLGDRQAARRQFDRALEALRVAPEAAVIDTVTEQAIRDGARLYREEGLAAQADLLDRNPRLRLPATEQPAASP